MFFRNSTIALGLLVATISCSKNHDDATPSTADFVYLPAVIYASNNPLDSFVYNDDNTVAKAFSGNGYTHHMEFDYNSDAQCKRVRYYMDNSTTVLQVDTVMYGADGAVSFTSYYPDRDSRSTVRMKLNSNGAITAFAEDTITDGATSKEALTCNLMFTGNNLTQYTSNYYWEYNGEVQQNNTTTYALTYNQQANSLLEFFRKNPYIQVVLGYYQIEHFLFTASANTLSSFSIARQGVEPQVYPVTNTFDNVTGMLTRQEVGNESNIYDIYTFTYIKVAKK